MSILESLGGKRLAIVGFKKCDHRIGQVYLMKFSGDANEQRGWRPGLVFQNNKGNNHSPNIIALPLTSSLKKLGQPTHVLIKAEESGLIKDSVVICENPERMSKDRIGSYITTLSEDQMEDVAIASLLSTSAIAFIKPEKLPSIWERAVILNQAA